MTISIKKFALLLATAYLSLVCSAALAVTGAATDLRVELLKGEHVHNIRDAQPEFSWVLPVVEKPLNQNQYQIQMALAEHGFQGLGGLVWDSGQVRSTDSIGVPYLGMALKPATTYVWRVKLWSKKGSKTVEHPWSQPQRFTTDALFNHWASKHDTIATSVDAKVIKRLPSGRTLIDFGKVAFGYLSLSLKADKAGEIVVHFGERGSEQGVLSELPERSSVRYYQVRSPVHENWGIYAVHPPRDVRNTKPNKAIPIPGQFGRIAPFRYVEIEAGDLELKNINATQIAIHYPFDEYASYFESSDNVLNDIWDLCKYSMKATSFAGVYVDGDRERIPYEADAYINQLSHYLVEDEYALARYSHEYLLEHPTWPTEWKQHSIMMAWVDWMYTGDIESLAHHYETLKNDKLLAQYARADGLLKTFPNQNTRAPTPRDIVDWPPSERDNFDFKDVNAVINAFYYLNLNQMADIAQALGKQEDATKFKRQAEKVATVYNQLFLDKETGLYLDGEGSTHSSFHANVAPLAFGLVPAENKASVVKFIKQKGMAGSVYFAQYLMEAMYEAGESDYALSLMTSKAKRSWYNMIRVGSTITLEAWDDEFKPNQDWNHAWGAVPGNIVGRYLLGVKPRTPGFDEFEVRPQLSRLDYAEGKVPSIKGPITVKVKQENNRLSKLTLIVPGNSHAHVVLPIDAVADVKQVRINGKKAKVKKEGNSLVFKKLGSGHYDISVIYQ